MVYSSYSLNVDLVFNRYRLPQMTVSNSPRAFALSDPSRRILLMTGRAGISSKGS